MFALIHNNQIVVGPRDWNYTFFVEYLIENNLAVDELPRQQPNSMVVSFDWKILPVKTSIPIYDQVYEQLEGPFYIIGESEVVGNYNVIAVPLTQAKNKLKQLVTDKRYQKEIGGLEYTFADGQTVNLYTNREDRSAYLDAMIILGDTQTITFKFPGQKFRTVTKTELTQIVAAGAQHLALCFGWEGSKHGEIDSCIDVDQLKTLNLTFPGEVNAF